MDAEKVLTREIAEQGLASLAEALEAGRGGEPPPPYGSVIQWLMETRYFDRYLTIDVAAAALLAGKLEYLSLDGLEELSDAAAESLSKHRGELSLNGLMVLSDATAERLGRHQGDLSLDGLDMLSDACAASLCQLKGKLSLRGLSQLTNSPGHEAIASRLIEEYDHGAFFGSLQQPDPFDHFTALPDFVIEAYCVFDGELAFSLTRISNAAAECLSGNHCDLSLDGLEELTDAAAESLSNHKHSLSLNSLTVLSDAAVESLSKYRGDLSLDGLEELSDAAAESLSKHRGELSLGRLTSFSKTAARFLAQHSRLHLD
jgi:hypothetical protein